MISAKQARANSNQHKQDFVKNALAELNDLIEDVSQRGETYIVINVNQFRGPINLILDALRANGYQVQDLLVSW